MPIRHDTERMEPQMTGWGKIGLLLGGFAIGTYGTKILGSKPLKKAYTQVAAGALYLKDEVMKDVTIIGENCGDIAAEAKVINEARIKERDARILQDAKDLIANMEPKRRTTRASRTKKA